VIYLADELRLNQFSVAGNSGGGPYEAACAYKIPNRLIKTGIISGISPTDVKGNLKNLPFPRRAAIAAGRFAPWFLKYFVWFLLNPHRDIDRYFKKIINESSQTDREILNQHSMKTMFKKTWQEGTRHGIRGITKDGILFSNPWGFKLCDIQTEVTIWHGTRDNSVPVTMARYMADCISDCQLKIITGIGHFLLFDLWDEI
jgi:pimeloyl-ACP methyl ester carboxylesterase